MVKQEHITIPQLARMLRLSRIEVYRKVKKGQIKAVRAGRVYLIADSDAANILGKELSGECKQRLDRGVEKVVKEYGELLKKLGRE